MFAMNQAGDATNISQAVREIKRVAADSLEESTSYNNDIYPALWHTDNDNVAAWQQASGRWGRWRGAGNHLRERQTHKYVHTHTHTLATLPEKQWALKTKSALVSPTGN